MKLLFDQNLSPRLVALLQDLFPGSNHVRNLALERADDNEIWVYAGQHDFVIVSKDSDFQQRSFLFGHPPKVLWVRKGNCSTGDIAAALRAHHHDLEAFGLDQEAALLVLS